MNVSEFLKNLINALHNSSHYLQATKKMKLTIDKFVQISVIKYMNNKQLLFGYSQACVCLWVARLLLFILGLFLKMILIVV